MTAFFGPNPRLPAEVLLNIVDALSIQDRLPLRILNRSWHAFFAGSLDSRVFAEVTLNYTARSFRALEDLAHAPVFRNYVTTITHRPSFLHPCPFIDEFRKSYHTYFSPKDITPTFPYDEFSLTSHREFADTYYEYVQLIKRQEILVDAAPMILPGLLRRFPRLSKIVTENIREAHQAFTGSSFLFDDCAVRYLADVDLTFLVGDAGWCWRERNIAAFTMLATALATSGAKITHFELDGEVGGGAARVRDLAFEVMPKAFKNCQQLAINYVQAQVFFDEMEEAENLIAQALAASPLLEYLEIRMYHGYLHLALERNLNSNWNFDVLLPHQTCISLRKTLRKVCIAGTSINVYAFSRLVDWLTPGLEVLELRDMFLEDARDDVDSWAELSSKLSARGVELQQTGNCGGEPGPWLPVKDAVGGGHRSLSHLRYSPYSSTTIVS